MNSVSVGTTIAVVVAGWPLCQLVTAGDLDATTAVLRGAVVAIGCAWGAAMIVKLAVHYETQAEAERKRRLNDLFTDLEGAVSDGSLRDGHDGPEDKPAAASN